MRAFVTTLGFIIGVSCLMAGDPGWRPLQPLPQARSGHAAVMVHTGDVLVVGGRDAGGSVLGTAWVVSGSTGTQTPTVNTDPTPRTNSAVVVVPSVNNTSTVYVIGGYTGTGTSYSSSATVTRLRFDDVQNTWRFEAVGSLPTAVGDCRAVYDGASSIIVSGGISQTAGAIASGTRSNASASIDIATGTIRKLGDHITARAEHGAYRFVDQGGTTVVMAAGGEAAPPPSTELLAGTMWDPRANAPLTPRSNASPVSDYTGTARVFGGESNGTVVASCEWYDPKSGWRNAPRMNEARARFSSTGVLSITDTAAAYIAVGGKGAMGSLRSCELFMLPTSTDPAGVWTSFDALLDAAEGRQVAMTGSNLPVVVSGVGTAGVEVYQPLRNADVSFPSTEVGARSDSVWVEITNTWLLPITVKKLQVLDGADFIVASDTTVIKLDPEESAKILAWFRPSQAGMRISRVALDMGIVADTFRLMGNGLASTVSVATSVMDHGDVQVGTTSRICLPLLKNNGTDTAWVDSIVVDPPAAYEIESPKGKTPVAPGQELTVCVLFKPLVRGSVSGSATMHIGPRSYPVAVLGKGIRTLAVVRASSCDTIAAQRNDVVTATALLENTGDRDVTVTDITVQAAVPGSVVLANPSIAPFTLRPAQVVPVDVLLTVQREGEERIQLTATSNSDSAISGTLCVVVRARNVVLNVSSINVGNLCLGDSVHSTIVLTNASAVDAITVTDVVIENTMQAIVRNGSGMIIAPRSAASIQVAVGAAQIGPINGSVVINTTTGSTAVPITGTVLDAVVFTMPDAAMAPGEIRPFALGVGTTSAPQLVVDLQFATDLLSVSSVQSIVGQVQLSPSSTVVRTPTGARLTLVWNGAPPSSPTQVNLNLEALRGADVVTDIRAVRAGEAEACVLSDTGVVRIDPSCGQERSLVKVGQGADVLVAPMPARGLVEFVVTSTVQTAMYVRVVDASSTVLFSQVVTTGRNAVNMTSMANGVYGIQLMDSTGLLDSQIFLLQR